MKKIILMTSALTLVGGTAFAGAHGGGEISVTGEAMVAYGNWDGAATGFSYGTTLTAAMEGSSNGITYGGEVSIDAVAGTVSNGTFYVSGGFGKFSFGADAFDVITDDVGDVMYEGTFGSVDVSLTADADGSGEWLATADYAGNGFNLGLETDSAGTTSVSADADVGNFTIGAGADSAGAWDVWASTDLGGISTKVTYDSASVAGIELAGTAGAVDWELTYNTDGDTTADLSTSFGDTSVSLAYDSTATGTGDDAVTVLSVEHTVGGLVMHVKANDASEYEIGATASFTF